MTLLPFFRQDNDPETKPPADKGRSSSNVASSPMGRHHISTKLSTTLLIFLAMSASAASQGVPVEVSPSKALNLHATAFMDSPNDWGFYGISGITYDASSKIWTGMNEGNPGAGSQVEVEIPRIFQFMVNWENYEGESSPRGTVDIISRAFVEPGDGLKCEGIVKVPCAEKSLVVPDYWIVSESNSNTQRSSSYFTKNFGHPDINTFVPESLRDSRFIRVGADGKLKEEIALPEFMLWDGEYNWDPSKCYGNRVLKGLHSLSVLEEPKESEERSQLIMIPQLALYQDGPEPTIFDGSQVRIMFWDIIDDGQNCATDVQYSRSYKYETSRMTIETFQKGARHVLGVFGALVISRTELLITETEFLEGLGIVQFISDVFYVKFDEGDTVDNCTSLMDYDCADRPFPVKRHLLTRHHPYEMSDLAWGPSVEKDGIKMPTVAISFEDDNVVGVLMELYTLNITQLELEPLWENNKTSQAFIAKRVSALFTAVIAFAVGVLMQIWWVRKQNGNVVKSDAQPSPVSHVEKTFCGIQYSKYLVASAVFNSTLLGGLVFGFPGLVLILRKDGVFAESCSCGVFCSGQQEKLAVLSTMGFVASIGSRLFAGLFLDRFGPKITSVCAGIVSTFGLIYLATAGDASQLSNRITPAWIILAIGGSAIHLTSFHVTNLMGNRSEKSQASVYISAGFGAGSLVLPVLQAANQYANVTLQSMCMVYAIISCLLTVNSFFHQPWRAWNAIGSNAMLDLNCCKRSWWPSNEKGVRKLTAEKKETDTKYPPLKEVMRSFAFWGECFWFSCQLFLLTYYLSTINQILFSLGDAKVNQDVDSPLNNMFTRAAIFFNGLGFLWTPLVGYLMQSLSFYRRIYLEIGMAFLMAMTLALPIIELQVIVFLVQALVRLQVFTYHFAYIADRFGFRHFGLLNGISSLIAALFGLAGYVLQIFSVYVTSGNFGVSYFFVSGLILASTLFPLLLRRADKSNLVFNWAESYAVDPRKFRYPENMQELTDLIQNNDEVRCVGSMHSCAPLVMSDGVIIAFDKLNKILHIDSENATVTVQPGVKIFEICEAVKPHNLAMGTLGTIDWQGAVGAVMTGTHGGSLSTPSLHDFVESYTLIKANGEIVTVTREDDPQLFSAMAPCMGVFGVVTECTFRLVKLQYLEAQMESMPFQDVIPMFKDIMQNNKYARIVVYPSIDMATVWRANPVAKKDDGVARGSVMSDNYVNFRDEYEKTCLEKFLVHQERAEYDKGDNLLHKVMDSQLKRLHRYEGAYNHVLCKERNHGIPHADIEFGFDYAKAEQVLTTVREWYLMKGNRMPYYNFEIRTTKQDDAMMSCCNGRDTLFIDFQAKASVGTGFFKQMEDLLKPFGYRKHWAKGMCHSNPEYIIQQFPNVGQFVELMGAFDPDGKFRNIHIQLWYQAIKDTLSTDEGVLESDYLSIDDGDSILATNHALLPG